MGKAEEDDDDDDDDVVVFMRLYLFPDNTVLIEGKPVLCKRLCSSRSSSNESRVANVCSSLMLPAVEREYLYSCQLLLLANDDNDNDDDDGFVFVRASSRVRDRSAIRPTDAALDIMVVIVVVVVVVTICLSYYVMYAVRSWLDDTIDGPDDDDYSRI
jgi:hypothetical protein